MSSYLSSAYNSLTSAASSAYNRISNAGSAIASAATDMAETGVYKGQRLAISAAITGAEQVERQAGEAEQSTRSIINPSEPIVANIDALAAEAADSMSAALTLAEIGAARAEAPNTDLRGRAAAAVAGYTFPYIEASASVAQRYLPSVGTVSAAAGTIIQMPSTVVASVRTSVRNKDVAQAAFPALVLIAVIYILWQFGPKAVEVFVSLINNYLSNSGGVLLRDGLMFSAVVYATLRFRAFTNRHTGEMIADIAQAQGSLRAQADHLSQPFPLYQSPSGIQMLLLGGGALASFNIGYHSLSLGYQLLTTPEWLRTINTNLGVIDGSERFTCPLDGAAVSALHGGVSGAGLLSADIRDTALLSLAILAANPEALANLLRSVSRVLSLPRQGLRVFELMNVLTANNLPDRLAGAHRSIIDARIAAIPHDVAEHERLRGQDRTVTNGLRTAILAAQASNKLYNQCVSWGVLSAEGGVVADAVENLQGRLQVVGASVAKSLAKKAAHIGSRKLYEMVLLPKAFDLALDFIIDRVFPDAGFIPSSLKVLKTAGQWYAYYMLMQQVVTSLGVQEGTNAERALALLNRGLDPAKQGLMQDNLTSLRIAVSGPGITPLNRAQRVLDSSARIGHIRGILPVSATRNVVSVASYMGYAETVIRSLPAIQEGARSYRADLQEALRQLDLARQAHLAARALAQAPQASASVTEAVVEAPQAVAALTGGGAAADEAIVAVAPQASASVTEAFVEAPQAVAALTGGGAAADEAIVAVAPRAQVLTPDQALIAQSIVPILRELFRQTDYTHGGDIRYQRPYNPDDNFPFLRRF